MRMEINGIKVDNNYLQKLSNDFSKRILKLEKEGTLMKKFGTEII